MNLNSFRFNDPIWKVIPDWQQNSLAVQTRDQEKKQTDFFSLTLNDSSPTLIYQSSNWCLNLFYTTDQKIFLHDYEAPDLPVPKGIFTFDTYKKNLLWEAPTALSPRFIHPNLFSLHPHFAATWIQYDLETGQVMKTLKSEYLPQANPSISDELKYPQVELAKSPALTNHELSILQSLPSPIQWVKHFEYLCVAHYSPKALSEEASLHLKVYVDTKKELEIDLANQKKNNFSDAFFLKGDFLVSMKGNNELIWLKLK